MAFQQQPTRPSTAHRITPTSPTFGGQVLPSSGVEEHGLEHSPADEHTWVLFSPTGDDSATFLTETDGQSLLTLGRSRYSDLGPATSDYDHVRARSAVIDDGGEHGQAEEEEEKSVEVEDAELDSLDGHLAEFRAHPAFSAHRNLRLDIRSPPRAAAMAPTVQLPSHDGLGTFRIQQPGSGRAVQEQIFAFERRSLQQQAEQRSRRRESQAQRERDAAEEQAREAEKMQRIEAWRLEQSQILLEEIQKLTRRRRRQQSENGLAKHRLLRDEEAYLGFGDYAAAAEPGRLGGVYGGGRHDSGGAAGGMLRAPGETEAEREDGFWTRITKKVIRELMGIDDRLLSILFGEMMPDEDDLTTRPRAGPVASMVAPESSWQLHVLERVARELGMLVNQLSHHPGAFSTYVRVQQMPLPYAGLPVIPETRPAVVYQNQPGSPPAGRRTDLNTSSPYIEFEPTMPPQPRVSPARSRTAGRTHRPEPSRASGPSSYTGTSTRNGTGNSATAIFTQEEWEQDLDIGLVFRYLRSRFTSRPSGANIGAVGAVGAVGAANTAGLVPLAGTSHLAMANTQDAAAKSARVRQHHPLVGLSARGRQGRVSKTGGAVAPGSSSAGTATTCPSSAMIAAAAGAAATATTTSTRPRPPSCSSRGTRRSSARRSSCSSRHYWDIGGSIGAGKTGSVIASAGPMGSWGEV